MTSDSLDYNSAQKMASRFWTQVRDARLHLCYFYIQANFAFPICVVVSIFMVSCSFLLCCVYYRVVAIPRKKRVNMIRRPVMLDQSRLQLRLPVAGT